jgi:hypothetical protein
MTASSLLAITALAAAAGWHSEAQQPAPQKFGAATTGVVIDVVVRDAKGRPVTDLTRADFEPEARFPSFRDLSSRPPPSDQPASGDQQVMGH